MPELSRAVAIPAITPEQSDRLHVFAHDIKNRLTGLWEVLRALRAADPDGLDPEELGRYAERAYFNAQRDLEDLLDDLHVDRNVTVHERSSIDLMEGLNRVLAQENHRLTRKEQTVVMDRTRTHMVLGDTLWLSRCLQALISNASKFSPRGSSIHVRVAHSVGTVSIAVTDQGVGLSATDLASVFTRYAMLSSRSTEEESQARGTLARAKHWAEAQSGSLQASSDGVGKGSTFTLVLPAA
jgi:signal transduction histidine kinase